MRQTSRVAELEQKAGHKRGRMHVHYADESNPCQECEASGPPKAHDTVLRVVYDSKPTDQADNRPQDNPQPLREIEVV